MTRLETPEIPSLPGHVPLAVATRGLYPESVHFGSIVVVDPEGRLIAGAGDPLALTFTRSSLKPFQALPLMAHPEVRRFDFNSKEIALICASHSGEPDQVEAVLEILQKIGCTLEDLQCGIHVPLAAQLPGRHPKPLRSYTEAHHNCSGNHAGMLALARLLEAPTATYLTTDHPVQRAIREAVSYLSGVAGDAIVTGIDGCSAPNLALPLSALARGYAGLAAHHPAARFGPALALIHAAMREHPEMVSGQGRFDLSLSLAGRGRWILKSGAEAVMGIALEGRRWGIAIKIADGASRALPVVAIETLRQLRQLRPPLERSLAPYESPPILSARGLEVGELRPVFSLA